MPRLLLLLLVALGGAAIWRRREIRNDADRASKAIADATGAAKSRIRPSGENADPADESTDEAADAVDQEDPAPEADADVTSN